MGKPLTFGRFLAEQEIRTQDLVHTTGLSHWVVTTIRKGRTPDEQTARRLITGVNRFLAKDVGAGMFWGPFLERYPLTRLMTELRRAGVSREQLAQKMGCSPMSVFHLLRGGNRPTGRLGGALCRCVNELLGGDIQPEQLWGDGR